MSIYEAQSNLEPHSRYEFEGIFINHGVIAIQAFQRSHTDCRRTHAKQKGASATSTTLINYVTILRGVFKDKIDE